MGSINSSSIQNREKPWVNLPYSSFASPPDLQGFFPSDLWMLNSGDASNLGLAREQHPQLGEKRCEGQSRHALNAKIGPLFNLSCTRIIYCTWCIRLIYFETLGSFGAFRRRLNYSTVPSSPAP